MKEDTKSKCCKAEKVYDEEADNYVCSECLNPFENKSDTNTLREECKDHSKCTSPFCTKYPNEDILQEEFMEFWDSKKAVLGLGNYSDAILHFFINKFNQKLEEIEREIEQKAHYSKLAGSKYDGYVYYKDVLQIIKNKKI